VREIKCFRIIVFLATALIALGHAGTAAGTTGNDSVPRFEIEFEAGAVWQSRNDVQIPNDESGTRFSLADLVGRGPWPAGRVYFTWNLNNRHGLRILLAPFTYTESGTFTTPVDFAEARFLPDTPTEATYKFNSWRLRYRYRFHAGSRWRWWIGFTAKIRDAKIQLDQGNTIAKDTDVGFVPLLHLAGAVRLGGPWSLLLDADALAGGPGRAEDVALKLVFAASDRLSISGGYRTLEGGADVDEVYNFAWFHYAVGSIILSF